MMEKERIIELVIKAGDIDDRKGFGLSLNKNLLSCPDCKSPLVYIKINWGVVAEDHEYGIVNNKSNRVYALREIGFSIFCSKCSEFIENYSKYFYPEEGLVMSDWDFDELDEDEKAEIQICLNQWNQKGYFKERFHSALFTNLRLKLTEYEKKHPIKDKHKKTKKINSKGRKHERKR